MSSAYFPVSFKDLGARIVPDHLGGGRPAVGREIGGVTIRYFPLNHPGGCRGYSFEQNGSKIVYATDNEIPLPPGMDVSALEQSTELRAMPEDLLAAVENADLLITDSQYDD